MSKTLADVKLAIRDLRRDMDEFSSLDDWGNYSDMPVPDEFMDMVLREACLTIRGLSAKVAQLQARYRLAILRWLLAEAEYKTGL